MNLSKSAVAVVGYPRSTSCVRPWALSYERLVATPGVVDPLSAAGYDALTVNTSIAAFRVGSGASTNSGVMTPVVTWSEPGFGHADAIVACSSRSIIVGNNANHSSGVPISATNAAVRELCEADGSPVFTCNNRVVKVVIYDSANPPEYSVRFVGAFTITCYNTGTDADADILGTCDGVTPAQIGDPEVARIFGRFTTMVDVHSTGFSLVPSPIRGPVALVQ